MDKAVLRHWLEAGYVDEGSLFETQAGTPQGGVISAVIDNMALEGLEHEVRASAGSDRARRLSKIYVIRYADDFVVTCASKDVLGSQVLPAIQRFLADRGLELSEEKTRMTHIMEGSTFSSSTSESTARSSWSSQRRRSSNLCWTRSEPSSREMLTQHRRR